MTKSFVHVLDDRSHGYSFFHLQFLALKFQSYRHQTLLKIVPPMHTVAPYIYYWRKKYVLEYSKTSITVKENEDRIVVNVM